MKKLFMILCKSLLAASFILFMYLQLQQPSVSDADFNTVKEKVMKKMESYSLVEQEDRMIKKNLSLDPSNYKNISYYASEDAMDVREIVIVEFKNVDQGNDFVKLMQNRVDEQINTFGGYGPEQVKLLKKANIESLANYGIYVTCENSDKIVSLFKDQL